MEDDSARPQKDDEHEDDTEAKDEDEGDNKDAILEHSSLPIASAVVSVA